MEYIENYFIYRAMKYAYSLIAKKNYAKEEAIKETCKQYNVLECDVRKYLDLYLEDREKVKCARKKFKFEAKDLVAVAYNKRFISKYALTIPLFGDIVLVPAVNLPDNSEHILTRREISNNKYSSEDVMRWAIENSTKNFGFDQIDIQENGTVIVRSNKVAKAWTSLMDPNFIMYLFDAVGDEFLIVPVDHNSYVVAPIYLSVEEDSEIYCQTIKNKKQTTMEDYITDGYVIYGSRNCGLKEISYRKSSGPMITEIPESFYEPEYYEEEYHKKEISCIIRCIEQNMTLEERIVFLNLCKIRGHVPMYYANLAQQSGMKYEKIQKLYRSANFKVTQALQQYELEQNDMLSK